MNLLEELVVCIIFISILLPRKSFGHEHERRLLEDLLKEYQILERPVFDERDPVELEFGISLRQIIDLDERNQLMKSNLWLEYNWKDVNLIWNSVSSQF